MGFTERKRWLLFGIPWTFTVYNIAEKNMNITTGLFSKTENDCYMYKIQDVTLQRNLLERMAGLGTIICRTGDSTHPVLTISHIKHAREVKEYILEKSEAHRLKRRTVNMQDIGAEVIMDADT